uniref:Formyl transferase N-terminal domain-containing protein n=1 Tax=uncultured marine bacterium 440 TaxID=257390 RepID=Q6SHB3_9BACT|nr:conserved hypothetical protein [uncultured marine bacterium 440]
MKKKIKIAYLLDNTNNWILKNLKNSELLKKNNKYNSKIFINVKKIINYDLVFILNYTKILKPSFLRKNKLNLAIHSSDLPEGKGFAPIQWQILEGKNKIYTTLFEAVEKFDSGRIFEKDYILLKGTELYDEIRYHQAKLIIKIIKKFLNKYPNIKSKRQVGKSTFYRHRYKSDSKLNINFSIKKLFNQMRVANNEKWPSFFYFKKKKFIIKIFKANLKNS